MATPDVNKRISDCGQRLVSAAAPLFAKDGVIHPATLVAATARMAGLFMFRSFALPREQAQPGQVILSSEANDKSQLLMRTCAAVLASLGKQIPNTPPDFKVLETLQPKIDYPTTQKLLNPVFLPLQSEYDLDDEQMARAGAIATGIVLYTVAKNLDHVRGFALACYFFIEGTKTVPV